MHRYDKRVSSLDTAHMPQLAINLINVIDYVPRTDTQHTTWTAGTFRSKVSLKGSLDLHKHAPSRDKPHKVDGILIILDCVDYAAW
jgi:hypothetical protein